MLAARILVVLQFAVFIPAPMRRLLLSPNILVAVNIVFQQSKSVVILLFAIFVRERNTQLVKLFLSQFLLEQLGVAFKGGIRDIIPRVRFHQILNRDKGDGKVEPGNRFKSFDCNVFLALVELRVVDNPVPVLGDKIERKRA